MAICLKISVEEVSLQRVTCLRSEKQHWCTTLKIKMPWLSMYYQVIWQSECLMILVTQKNIWLAYIDGHNATPPNVGFIKKPISRCVLKIQRLVHVLTPHWDKMGESDLLSTCHEISREIWSCLKMLKIFMLQS